jgi:hypothetical protein
MSLTINRTETLENPQKDQHLHHAHSESNTGCGRKNSPIWEANKLKTKEDTANVFDVELHLFVRQSPGKTMTSRVRSRLEEI